MWKNKLFLHLAILFNLAMLCYTILNNGTNIFIYGGFVFYFIVRLYRLEKRIT